MTNDELIQSVVCMLAIDRKIDDSEAQFLNSLCKHLGVSQKIVELAIKKAKQGKGRVHIPDEPAERKRLFKFLVQAATADGKVVHQEQKILDAVAAKFGIPNQEVEEAIRIWLPEAVATPPTAEISAKGSPHPPKAKTKAKPQHYNVVFQGKIVKGKKPENVKKNLASLFKANITDIEKIFTGKPVVVKEKVSQEIALKFQEAFKQAGAVCRIEAITPPATAKKVPKKAVKQAAQQQAVQPGMMICPKCGFEQKQSPKCKQCSIFIKKYLEMEKAKQAEEKAIIEEAPAEISPNPKNPKKPKKDDLLGQQLQQMVKAGPEESTAPSSKKR